MKLGSKKASAIEEKSLRLKYAFDIREAGSKIPMEQFIGYREPSAAEQEKIYDSYAYKYRKINNINIVIMAWLSSIALVCIYFNMFTTEWIFNKDRAVVSIVLMCVLSVILVPTDLFCIFKLKENKAIIDILKNIKYRVVCCKAYEGDITISEGITDNAYLSFRDCKGNYSDTKVSCDDCYYRAWMENINTDYIVAQLRYKKGFIYLVTM